jgi:hypothetical protein
VRAGAPAERRPTRALGGPPALVLAALALASLCVVCGCGGSTSAPRDLAQAYRVAHPGGAVPPGLCGVRLTRLQVASRIAAVVEPGARVLLPRWLPPGTLVAAPYISVGDGSVRPNPEGWGASYRVSYTDGRNLLVLTVGARPLAESVAWSGPPVPAAGRQVRTGRTGSGVVVVETWYGDRRVVAVGHGYSAALVRRIALRLAPCR